jgi:Fur family ferric uptake transcriptional regulator
MRNLLKNKRIRETSFRLEVLKVLSENENPISMDHLEKSLPKFDRITLYRTIKTFLDKGLIHEVLIAGESKKIALCSIECNGESHIHHLEHVHFFCENCKETFCLELEKFPTITIPNHSINSFEIQAKGICQNCK